MWYVLEQVPAVDALSRRSAFVMLVGLLRTAFFRFVFYDVRDDRHVKQLVQVDRNSFDVAFSAPRASLARPRDATPCRLAPKGRSS